MHDCFASYWKIDGVKHGICNFHTTRELKALFEIDSEEWADEMRVILYDALKLTINAREQDKNAVDPEDIRAIEERYHACLKRAIAFLEGLEPLVPPSGKKRRGRRKRRTGTIWLCGCWISLKPYALYLVTTQVPKRRPTCIEH